MKRGVAAEIKKLKAQLKDLKAKEKESQVGQSQDLPSVQGQGEDERQKFSNLLHKYADIFAGSGDDLGRTSKLKHCINTGTTTPIRQPVHHISSQCRDEVC